MAPRKQPTPTDDRARLERLRDTLEAAIDATRQAPEDKQGSIAPLAKQYRDTLEAIAKLPVVQKSTLDELKKRRTLRAAGAPVPARTKRAVAGGRGSDRAGSVGGSDPGPVAAKRSPRSASRGA